jgi:molecular chaperone GrpE (heat shock protein)
MVLMPDGSEITYNLYEKRKAEAPKEQVSLSVFPDFEEEFIPKLKEVKEELDTTSDILLRIAADFQKLSQKLKS